MSRATVLTLYAVLVLIWSSTWVAIKIGLEDCPPLLGAGIRFALAGVVLLVLAAVQRRPLHTDWVLAAVLALAPFAFAYGLVYWGEQYVPSGLAAVLFGVMPLYTALLAGVLLPEEPLRAPLVIGVLIGIGGLALAFLESVELGSDKAAIGAARARARSARRGGGERFAEAPRRRAGRRGPERLGHAGGRASAAAGLGAGRDTGATLSGAPSRWARSPIWRCSDPPWPS